MTIIHLLVDGRQCSDEKSPTKAWTGSYIDAADLYV